MCVCEGEREKEGVWWEGYISSKRGKGEAAILILSRKSVCVCVCWRGGGLFHTMASVDKHS